MIYPKQKIITPTDQIIENTKRKIIDLNLPGIHVFVGKARLILIKMVGGRWDPEFDKKYDFKTNKNVHQMWHMFKKRLITKHPVETFFWKIPIPRKSSYGVNDWQCCTQFYPVPDDRGETSKWHDCNIPYLAGLINRGTWPREWPRVLDPPHCSQLEEDEPGWLKVRPRELEGYLPIYSDYQIFELVGKKTRSKVHCLYCNKIIEKSEPRRRYCDNNGECKKKAYIIRRRVEDEAEYFFNKAAHERQPLDILAIPVIGPDGIEWTPQIPTLNSKTTRECKNCGGPIPIIKHGKAIFCDECNTPAKRMNYYRRLWKTDDRKKD